MAEGVELAVRGGERAGPLLDPPLQLGVGPVDILLGAPLLGEVARDLAEAAEPVRLAAQRGDDDVGEEALLPSLRTRQPKSSRRPSRSATISSCSGLPLFTSSGG